MISFENSAVKFNDLAKKGRPILQGPEDKKGLFKVPKTISTEDEVKFAKLRMRTVRLAQYSDETCGLPNTYDPTGAYLCGGLKTGKSSPCNMFVIIGQECLIRDPKKIDDPHHFSCGFWETVNSGDPEGRKCDHGRMDDKRIQAGSTKSNKGFSCERCEYGIDQDNWTDSEGRHRFCTDWGHPVGEKSCCADNEPLDE